MCQCFARWKEDKINNLDFRDQTILQFGTSWKLLASFILLNPGSATPLKQNKLKNTFLAGQKLPFYVNSGNYYEFTVDPLMRSLINLYSSRYPSGGVLKLYNLFNLKNQCSGTAIKQFKNNMRLPLPPPSMLTSQTDAIFLKAPVVIACGRKSSEDKDLIVELKKYISWPDSGRLYSLSKIGTKKFKIVQATSNTNKLIESYHPSYTCDRYGNTTTL